MSIFVGVEVASLPNDRDNILNALREKPRKVFEIMRRANITNEEACQSLPCLIIQHTNGWLTPHGNGRLVTANPERVVVVEHRLRVPNSSGALELARGVAGDSIHASLAYVEALIELSRIVVLRALSDACALLVREVVLLRTASKANNHCQ